MIRRLKAADHTILTLLLSIGLLPFTTALMAAYLNHAHGQHLAAAIYSESFLAMSIAFLAQHQILFPKAPLLQTALPERGRRAILARSATGLVPYVIATALAPVSAYATLAVCGAVAAFYALPRATADPSE